MRTNVVIPRALVAAAKEAGINVSDVCRRALRAELERRDQRWRELAALETLWDGGER